MINSMTAFGAAHSESSHGTLNLELRTVNSRFLDIHMRLPDDLRFLEGLIREHLARRITRGKVDVRLSYRQAQSTARNELDPDHAQAVSRQLEAARAFIADVPAPTLHELLQGPAQVDDTGLDADAWTQLYDQAFGQAIDQLQSARRREGQRLADTMLAVAADMDDIVTLAEQRLPELTRAHQQKIAERLRDVLEAASPQGFEQISGSELSARIAQEASLFSLRNDIAEELARLRSHMQELQHLLRGTAGTKKQKSSTGKRLDFLCQEMNREANTLGSKAASLDITHAAIDLKLLIEQLREQAQNIE